MLQKDTADNVAAFLTSDEAAELARIKGEDAVVGYALFNNDGETLELKGMPEETVAVFANVFDIAGRIGAELGEQDGHPLAIFENRQIEIFGISLSSAKAVVLRRKGAKKPLGLHNVS